MKPPPWKWRYAARGVAPCAGTKTLTGTPSADSSIRRGSCVNDSARFARNACGVEEDSNGVPAASASIFALSAAIASGTGRLAKLEAIRPARVWQARPAAAMDVATRRTCIDWRRKLGVHACKSIRAAPTPNPRSTITSCRR